MKFFKYLILATLSMLGACQYDIDYIGTECAVPDGNRAAYSDELTRAYQGIDSVAFSMLALRGPKGSRVENEDIDDEYDGARNLLASSRSATEEAIRTKYCIIVDRYRMSDAASSYIYVNDLNIRVEDTAVFHRAKRASLGTH